MDPRDKEAIERLIRKLTTAMRVLGVSNREVERRIGLSPSYLSRLFNGLIELRVEHVLAISRAIGLSPGELFALAYPQQGEPPSEAAARLRKVLEDLALPLPAPPTSESKPLSDEELDRRIEAAVLKAMAENDPGN
ncbi:MAG TPA: helix-turn-helix transcriptional regulator [Thermoanaerobaculia bacterium]